MKCYNILALVGLIVIFHSCGVHTSIKNLEDNKETQNKILKIHLDKFRWMAEKNMDSLSLLLDENVQYIHSNGWIESKAEVLNNIESDYLTYHKVDVLQATVRQFNSLFIVTGQGLFNVSLNSKPIQIPLLYTEVYSVGPDKISLVQRHACKKPDN